MSRTERRWCSSLECYCTHVKLSRRNVPNLRAGAKLSVRCKTISTIALSVASGSNTYEDSARAQHGQWEVTCSGVSNLSRF
jgi:hypothetical protein